MALHLETIREEEAARIARAVHDELGHALTSLHFDIAWLEDKIRIRPETPTPQLLERIQSMSTLLNETVHMVQRISEELRPKILDDFGLEEALQWQSEAFSSRTGIVCAWKRDPIPVLDRQRSLAVFRIFKEILTNVARHSGAGAVEIFLGAKDGEIILEVVDDGCGIPEGKIRHSQSLGLQGMRERALLAGGSVEFGAGHKVGARVVVRMPERGDLENLDRG